MPFTFIEKEISYRDYHLMTYELGATGVPILFIHGKPGSSSLYLREAYKQLVKHGFKLYFWDQLGCGKSDKPEDPALWTIERYVEEIEAVRKSLGLKNFHLLGHSWGGMLAIEYALNHQQHLKSLVLSNTTADCNLMRCGLERHKDALGFETARMMTRREIEGTTSHPEYIAAKTLLLYRHVCRLETWPEALVQTFAECNLSIFNSMFGPYFFNFTGSVSSFNRTAELEKIKISTLIFQGEYDEIIPECAQLMHGKISGSQVKILKETSHMPFFENPELYFKELIPFLIINS